MVFALLIAAIVWNLGTWWLGLPASSSHTMIGSIVGVGIANALMHGRTGFSGVDWAQVTKVGYALLLSPIVGFVLAAGMFFLLKVVVKNKALYSEPKKNRAPPWWIRSILILTCTGVSFAHGSNDGQKGMGLIMLILVGTVPLAYALNRAMPVDEVAELVAVTKVTQQSLEKISPAIKLTQTPQEVLKEYVRTSVFTPEVLPALTAMTGSIAAQIQSYGNSLANVTAGNEVNMRNDMYLVSETINRIEKNAHVKFDPETQSNIIAFKKLLNNATKFIPLWVKVIVAISLGLGTMVGWKRIVVTVGEKIGKTHLTYAQGASAETIAMITIGLADEFGLPVSTTHVLSSGIAGTMAANNSGLQLDTIRNIVMAWVFTLPVAMILSGSLYWVFSNFT
jgi:PiT family inorganic phosphate transporter